LQEPFYSRMNSRERENFPFGPMSNRASATSRRLNTTLATSYISYAGAGALDIEGAEPLAGSSSACSAMAGVFWAGLFRGARGYSSLH